VRRAVFSLFVLIVVWVKARTMSWFDRILVGLSNKAAGRD
jgi:hypothetical protein